MFQKSIALLDLVFKLWIFLVGRPTRLRLPRFQMSWKPCEKSWWTARTKLVSRPPLALRIYRMQTPMTLRSWELLGWWKLWGMWLPFSVHVAPRDLFKTSDHAQQRWFTATRGADENHEFTVFDIKVDALDYLDVTIGFGDIAEC